MQDLVLGDIFGQTQKRIKIRLQRKLKTKNKLGTINIFKIKKKNPSFICQHRKKNKCLALK